MNMLALILASGITHGYPLCQVTESVPGVISDVKCVTAQIYRGRRFCGFIPGVPPGGIFADYNAPLRYVFLTDLCPVEERDDLGWCPSLSITGYADLKEVARNGEGVATATALIKRGWEPFLDSFEPLDLFGESACTFSFTP